MPASAQSTERLLLQSMRAVGSGSLPRVLARVDASTAVAQTVTPPANRHTVSAGDLLQGRPVADSFATVEEFLSPGDEVRVRDSEGHTTRGWVSAITRDSLVVYTEGRSPLLRLWHTPRNRTFAADSIARIDAVDSPLDGMLIGALIGTGAAVAVFEHANAADNMAALGAGVVCITPGFVVGAVIDWLHTQPVYRRASPHPAAVVAPDLRRGSAALTVRLAF